MFYQGRGKRTTTRQRSDLEASEPGAPDAPYADHYVHGCGSGPGALISLVVTAVQFQHQGKRGR